MGGSVTTYREISTLNQLKSHPNFKMPIPAKDENIARYTCRCIAHLISPEQDEGESNNLECVDLAAAIKLFYTDIINTWVNHSLKLKDQ